MCPDELGKKRVYLFEKNVMESVSVGFEISREISESILILRRLNLPNQEWSPLG